jgi:hypothetical protein
MNKVPVQNVIPGLIEPFPLLVLIVTCLVGDQQPFAFLTNASQGNVMPGGIRPPRGLRARARARRCAHGRAVEDDGGRHGS